MPNNSVQVMPPLTVEEFAALKEDIRANGVRVPVVKDAEDRTLDGHHRERAVQELRDEGHDVPDYSIEVRSDLETDAEKRDLAWRLNMQRRHLSAEEKRKLIEAKLKETPDWSNNRLAKVLGVDDHTVRSARHWLEGTSEIPKLDRLEGEDGKKRPRSRERDHVKEFETVQRKEVRRKLLSRGLEGVDDEYIAKDVGVAPEAVAAERYDLATHGVQAIDTTAVGRDDLTRVTKRLTPRSNKEAAEAVDRILGWRISELLSAIEGRKIDTPITPQHFVEERRKAAYPGMTGDATVTERSADTIRKLSEWLAELADLIDD